MTVVHTFAGIGWDPEIRGILTVVVGAAVLMGSVYLLLATNLAQRLGFMVALAALFGWLTIHGFVWWIYPPGMGPTGRPPAWEIEELNHGNLEQAALDEARDIETSQLPDPEELGEYTPEQMEELSADQAEQLDGWTLLPEGAPIRGEAQTAVDTALAEGIIPGLATPDDYVYRYALETGGKPGREGDGWWDRTANKITNTLRITHPPHYAVVQLQPAIEQEPVPGEPPPTPEPDPDGQVISAVLVRDLGETRLPAALLTLGSASTFGLMCVMLHKRDQRVAEHRSAPLPAVTE